MSDREERDESQRVILDTVKDATFELLATFPASVWESDRVAAATINAYATIQSALIIGTNAAAASINQAMGMNEPDDANRLTYAEGMGASIQLEHSRGRVILESDPEDSGMITIRYVRDVDGRSTIHTVSIDDGGITE